MRFCSIIGGNGISRASKLSELSVLPLIADFVLPLYERSGNIANRNIVVILSGSTDGYIEMMASL